MIELEHAEAEQVLTILTQTKEFPWLVTNPLIMRLAGQLRPQPGPPQQAPAELRGNGPTPPA